MRDSQRELSILDDNIQDLQEQSLKIIALLPGMAGYSLLVWAGWLAFKPLPGMAWLGIGLLIGCAMASLLLKDRHLALAAHVLVWGVWGAIACVLVAYPDVSFSALLALPILFASVLLGRGMVFVIAALTEVVILLTLGQTSAWYAGNVLLPLVAVPLVAIAAWLSVHNLYTALAWVWNGYERALRNENEARIHEAELKQALKALDEATHRLHRANYMMTLSRDQAEDARRLKQQFAQTISHELRTPLNLIVGFTEVMLQSPEYYGGPLPPPYLRDLGIVYRNAGHLQGLVNDVLDLARIEAAQMSLSPEKVSPTDLVRDALYTIRSLVESRNLTLGAEIAEDLPPMRLDPTRIRQVLFNLVTNAARFTERGRITVGVRAEAERVVFWVQDTGIGIAPADQARIFEEFQQVDSSSSRLYGGMGLGLPISKRFVELHGGHIWVESAVGEGSTFYFSLPLQQGAETFSDISSPRALSVRAVKTSERPILLVVTRSPSAASLLTRYMHGFQTVTVLTMTQAQVAAEQLTPQMVIIDRTCESLDCVDLDTLAVAWELPRALWLVCPLPGEESMRQRLAADGYLVKPVSRASLWNTLRRFGDTIDDILIIDDDQDFVLFLSRLLENNAVRRYRVRDANTAEEGLAMMAYRLPDLVLLDLMLPDLPGVEVLERMHAREDWAQVPVIIVSAQGAFDEPLSTKGVVMVSKGDGLQPGEIIKWMQSLADTIIKPDLTLSEL